jgi:hypothetical protein
MQEQNSSIEALSVKDSLDLGVLYNNARHRDFVIRPPRLADHLAVIAEMGIGPSPAADDDKAAQNAIAASNTERNARMLARQLDSLGGIPKSEITGDLLLSSMEPSDFADLWRAGEEAKKKWLALPTFGANGHTLSNSSGNDLEFPPSN